MKLTAAELLVLRAVLHGAQDDDDDMDPERSKALGSLMEKARKEKPSDRADKEAAS